MLDKGDFVVKNGKFFKGPNYRPADFTDAVLAYFFENEYWIKDGVREAEEGDVILDGTVSLGESIYLKLSFPELSLCSILFDNQRNKPTI